MSTLDVDDPPVTRDAKAGFSSWCRRTQHETCKRIQAKCSCTCHGRHGQTPPPPKGQTAASPRRGARPDPLSPAMEAISQDYQRAAEKAAERRASTPPTPDPIERKEGTPMSDTTTDLRCPQPDCDFVAARINGLTRHLNQTHGIKNGKAQTPPPTNGEARQGDGCEASPAEARHRLRACGDQRARRRLRPVRRARRPRARRRPDRRRPGALHLRGRRADRAAARSARPQVVAVPARRRPERGHR